MTHSLIWRHLALAIGLVAVVIGVVARRRQWGRASIALGLVLLVGTFAIDPGLRHAFVEGFQTGSRSP